MFENSVVISMPTNKIIFRLGLLSKCFQLCRYFSDVNTPTFLNNLLLNFSIFVGIFAYFSFKQQIKIN